MARDLVKILGYSVDKFSMDEAVDYIQTNFGQVVTINPEMINAASNNKDFAAESRLICLMARDKSCAEEALKIVNSTCFSDDACKNIAEAMQRVFDNDLPFSASEITANIKGDADTVSKAYDVLMLDVSSLDLMGEALAYANKVRHQYYMRKIKVLRTYL